MTKLAIVSVLLGLSIAMSPAGAAQKKHPIVAIKKAMLGSYHSGGLPKGYSDVLLDQKSRPKFTKSFLNYLARLEVSSERAWKKYVLETDEEWEHLSTEDRIEISRDAKGHIGVRYLVEIQEVYKVFKNGKAIGYVFEAADHVHAAIIQDGAGKVIYTDLDLNVITTDTWES